MSTNISTYSLQRRSRTKRTVSMIFKQLFFIVYSVLVVFPLIWVIFSSFKDQNEIYGTPWELPTVLRWDNYVRAFIDAKLGIYFINSIYITAISLVLILIIGSMAAYVIARIPFRGQRFFYYLFMGGLIFTIFMVLVPLFMLLKDLRILNSHIGLVLVYIAYSMPFTVFILVGFFRTLPDELAQAARIDGCNEFTTFSKVMLPMSKSGLVTAAILNVLGIWNEFILAMISLNGEDITAPWSKWPSYQDVCAEFDLFFRKRRDIHDDSIPVALPGLGLGPWGGMFGAEVTLQAGVSSSTPFNSLAEIENLVFDQENHWVKYQLDAVAYFCEQSRGKFAVAPPETAGGVNTLWGLRGNDIFIDMMENPAACIERIDWMRSIGIWLLEREKEIIGRYQGGIFDHWQVWMPGNPVWISVDMNSLCSPEFYDTFGYHDTQAFLDHFNGGFIHVHKPTGTYLLPKMAKHTNVTGFEFLHDLGYLDTCFEGLLEIKNMVQTGIHIDCDFRQFVEQIENNTLPAGIIYHVKECPGVDEANRLMSRVRQYRNDH